MLSENDFIHAENRLFVEDYFQKIIRLGLLFKTNPSLIHKESVQNLKNIFLTPLPEKGEDLTALLDDFKQVADFSTNFSSSKFMAFPDAGNSISGVAAGILIPLLNQNLINAEHCSPAGSFVEMAVINWLREVLGLSVCSNPKNVFEVGGIITSGGTISNMIALMGARNRLFPKAKDEGVYGMEKVKILVPKGLSHYSLRCSLSWLGLGEKNVVEVDVTQDLTLDLSDLERKTKEVSQTAKIMAIVCYAGDSRAMALDHFDEIADIAEKNHIWFHVDACHGFQFAFHPELKKYLKGIERADSITMDPHKVLCIPYVLSALTFKNPKDFELIASNSDLIMKEDFAFGQITPMLGSRAFNSLKLWAVIKALGREKIGEMVMKRHLLACTLFKKLSCDSRFIVVNKKVGINSVLFMIKPQNWDGDVDRLNAFNRIVYRKLFDENKFYLHNFPFPDVRGQFNGQTVYPLRYMSGNYLANEKELDEMINAVKETADEVEKNK